MSSVVWAKQEAGIYRGFTIESADPRYYTAEKWDDGWSLVVSHDGHGTPIGVYRSLRLAKARAEADAASKGSV